MVDHRAEAVAIDRRLICARSSRATSTTPIATTPIFRSAPSRCPTTSSYVLEQSAPIDQLVVIGTGNPELTGEVFSRRAAKILRKSDCSLMMPVTRRLASRGTRVQSP